MPCILVIECFFWLEQSQDTIKWDHAPLALGLMLQLLYILAGSPSDDCIHLSVSEGWTRNESCDCITAQLYLDELHLIDLVYNPPFRTILFFLSLTFLFLLVLKIEKTVKIEDKSSWVHEGPYPFFKFAISFALWTALALKRVAWVEWPSSSGSLAMDRSCSRRTVLQNDGITGRQYDQYFHLALEWCSQNAEREDHARCSLECFFGLWPPEAVIARGWSPDPLEPPS